MSTPVSYTHLDVYKRQVMSGIDRFVYHIPNVIYIPVAILGIALILIGFFKDKSK